MSRALTNARRLLVKERDRLQATFEKHAAAMEEIEEQLGPLRQAIEVIPEDKPDQAKASKPNALVGKTAAERKQIIQCIGVDVKLGLSSSHISKHYGISTATLRNLTREHGWQRPPIEVTPLRMCEECQQRTKQDPCGRCGAKWNRS